MLGTVEFTAPETRLGRRPDARVDQFSLGIIAYQLLTGKHPYGNALDKAQSLRDFSLLRYTPSYEHNPLIPVWLDGAIRKACSVDPQNRYEALSEFEHDLTHPNDKFLLTEPLAKVANRSLTAWKLTAVALLALVVMLLILLMNR